ncbi:MAG: hypothetical protein AAGA48_25265 [Myxococcota bacterium]
MTRLRNWLLAAVVGGLFVASPAFAGPYRGGSLRHVVQQQEAEIARLVAERNTAQAQVAQLQRRVAQSPTPGQWANAQSQIASLERQLVEARRFRGQHLVQKIDRLRGELELTQAQLVSTEARLAEAEQTATRRRRRVERLRNELYAAEARIARLETRLGVRATKVEGRSRGRRVVVVDD